jgi:hypothetical protein
MESFSFANDISAFDPPPGNYSVLPVMARKVPARSARQFHFDIVVMRLKMSGRIFSGYRFGVKSGCNHLG